MSQRTLVDTSAWIEALRPDGDEEVRGKVRAVLEEGVAVFCDLVRLELWNGARGRREQEVLANLERELETLPTDEDVWERARELARSCRRSGITVPATDLLIVSCAVRHGTALLHRDVHFDRIRQVAPP